MVYIKNIDKKEAANLLDKIEKELSFQAENYPALKGKFAGLRKYRVGNYRIIYSIIEDTILILSIKHRKQAYR